MKRKAFKTALPYTVPIFAGSAGYRSVSKVYLSCSFSTFFMYPTANVTKNSYTAKYLGLFNNLFLALSM